MGLFHRHYLCQRHYLRSVALQFAKTQTPHDFQANIILRGELRRGALTLHGRANVTVYQLVGSVEFGGHVLD
jgi:hypothetical protein